MPDYFAFGGCLRTEVEFPDLTPAAGCDSPTWRIRVVESPAADGGELQGTYELQEGWVFRLHRVREGLRLDYGSNGSYEVLHGGSEIVWHPGLDRREELVRSVLIGPVMALALHQSGRLCLHGSAVSLDGSGIAFLAAKGFGKSTLALTLVAAGARLMSDDIVVVERADSPRLVPGVHSVRMFRDVSDRLLESFPGTTLRPGWKGTLTDLPRDRLGWEPVPLEAIYVLGPSAGERDTSRRPLTRGKAIVSIACQTKLVDDLVGYEEAGTMLGWIADLLARVPAYELVSPWRLDRLPEVVDRLRSWHTREAAAPSDPV